MSRACQAGFACAKRRERTAETSCDLIPAPADLREENKRRKQRWAGLQQAQLHGGDANRDIPASSCAPHAVFITLIILVRGLSGPQQCSTTLCHRGRLQGGCRAGYSLPCQGTFLHLTGCYGWGTPLISSSSRKPTPGADLLCLSPDLALQEYFKSSI